MQWAEQLLEGGGSEQWGDKWEERCQCMVYMHHSPWCARAQWAERLLEGGGSEQWGDKWEERCQCMVYMHHSPWCARAQWAERLLEGGGSEQWGDKWEERFKQGTGGKTVRPLRAGARLFIIVPPLHGACCKPRSSAAHVLLCWQPL